MQKILVVGVGSIGERHVRCFINTNRVEVGICEINGKLRDAVSEKYKLAGSFGSLEKALDEKWDAAVIASPAHTHIPIAQPLAEAGVHLFIEKPLAVKPDGIDELIRTVEQRKLAVAVAYVNRAHPGVVALREAVQSGRFGKPVQLVAVCGANFPFYRPVYRDIYYARREQGGGAVQDALTHILNIGEWVVGPIHKLVADGEHKVLDGVEVEDTVNLLCRHGEVMGSYALNQHQAPNEITITVVCEAGIVRLELHRMRVRWMNEPEGVWHDEVIELKDRDDWFTRQANAFLDTLEGKAEPLCSLREGLQSLRVNIAALESMDENSYWKEVIRG